ncbi:hypothetical protein ES705_09611 [subsurface metagenome]
MVNPRCKKLELSWFNKDKVLIWDEKKKEYIWVAPNDLRAAEPRILKEKKVVGNPNSLFNAEGNRWEKLKKLLPKEEQNLLVKGDNLLALKSLEDNFTEKIKLIYIDPPFNTGSRINSEGEEVGYDDGLEHSIWLSMMKDRLEILNKVLSKDGIIFVHIDFRELAHLKLIMDQIFKPSNFLTLITLKAKAGAGVGQESYLFDICEYILAYAKDKTLVFNKVPFIAQPISDNVTGVYNKILVSLGKDRKVKVIKGGTVGKIDVYVHKNYKIESIPNVDRTMKKYYNNFDFIFRTTNPQGGLMRRVMPQLPKKGLVSIEYIPSKGRSAGKKYRYYFINGSLITWLKDSAIKDIKTKQVDKLVKNNNIWLENLHQGIANEGNVKFKQSKKPEKLIKRIVEMVTGPNDWVLDSFAGSGTTGVVAHKMGRRWIMIELGPHADTHCLKRLKGVVDGSDQTGISKEVGWKGGGGFRYCILGKSLFKKDNLGIVEVTYDNGPLIEAVCKIEGFKFVGREFLDKTKLHGVVNEKRFCHVTEEFVTQDYIDDLTKEIKEDESLVIYCMKKMSRLNLPDNVQVKKIPRDIVKKFKLE